MNEVGDIVAKHLKILFIGFNPGLRSAQTGHHFAGPSNRFWKLLFAAGLTPYLFKPEEDRLLLQFGLGITNIVPRPSREAAELTKEEYRVGAAELRTKLALVRPQIACYEGIGVYREFAGIKKIAPGKQPVSVVPDILDFVVPSPSGRNPILFAEQLKLYRELKSLTG